MISRISIDLFRERDQKQLVCENLGPTHLCMRKELKVLGHSPHGVKYISCIEKRQTTFTVEVPASIKTVIIKKNKKL